MPLDGLGNGDIPGARELAQQHRDTSINLLETLPSGTRFNMADWKTCYTGQLASHKVDGWRFWFYYNARWGEDRDRSIYENLAIYIGVSVADAKAILMGGTFERLTYPGKTLSEVKPGDVCHVLRTWPISLTDTERLARRAMATPKPLTFMQRMRGRASATA